MIDSRTLYRIRSQFTLVVGTICLLAAARPVVAQEESVKPGINDRYVNENAEDLVPMLEQEERAIYKYRYAIVAALGLEAGMDVADVGSGSGFFTRLIAKEVGPEGRVYAVDINQSLLDHGMKVAEEGITNITPVLGTHKETNLPAGSFDVIFMCDTYLVFRKR